MPAGSPRRDDLATPNPDAATGVERVNGYAPIDAYAAIGDGRSLALITRGGTIDWLCLPELDAPSVFGAILDPAAGGSFALSPAVPFESERRYIDQTNVLETTFRTADGVIRVTDALSRPAGEASPGRELIRRVDGLAGSVPVRWRIEPRFDYGAQPALIERTGDAFILSGQRDELRLGLQCWEAGQPGVAHGALSGAFTAQEGSSALLVLVGERAKPLLLPGRDAAVRRLDGTVAYWRRWVARNRFGGQWAAAVERSLLAIGLLADDRTGAIAAAGTTSLPEAIGKQRNYDYRFAWIRDLSFTLDALLRVGFDDLVQQSFSWLLSATRHTHPRVNPVYRLGGDVLGGQESLTLPGYRNSRPVHLGNQATAQLQLGGFGDFLETAWMYTRHGAVLDPESGARIADIVDLLARIWRRPDAGLWELGDYAQYATSKLSCWTAFDRALHLAEEGQVPGRNAARWRIARDELKSYIEHELWSDEKRSYLQKPGSDALDAGCLLAARRGYADPRGERMNATIDAVRSELSAGGPLLYRYSGMQDQENAFLACSFWCVEALAAAHRFDEATAMMDSLTGLATDVGLYAEEMEPSSRTMRGNIPQALTHLALINAAVLLDENLAQARRERSQHAVG